MAILTIGYGIALILTGIAGYVMSGAPTALIPVAIGVAMVILGIVARNPKLHMHVMHAAVLLALIAIIGSFGGIPAAIRLIGGAQIERPLAAVFKSIACLLSMTYFGLCVNSFIQARIKRKALAKA